MSGESELIPGEVNADAVESSGAWGAMVDPTEFLRDDMPYPAYGAGYFVNLPSDREDGQDFPFFQTEQDLGVMRAIGRLLAQGTEWGVGALETLAAFILGTGFSWKVVVKKTAPDQNLAAQICSSVNAVLDEIIRVNSWTMDRDDESIKRASRDGEMFIAIFDGRDVPAFRFVEPSQIVEPPRSVQLDIEAAYGLEPGNWKFGVHTRTGDVETVLGYFVQWGRSVADFSYIPESRMLHIKRNVDRNVKRGVSDFYPLQKTLPKSVKLLSNMVHGGALQAAIAWILKLDPMTTTEQAESISQAGADPRMQPSSIGRPGATTRPVTNFPAGSTITIKNGDYLPGPMGAERNQGFNEVLQAALRTVGIRWTMPEFMISGDASNANYASTLVSNSPFGRARRRDQSRYGAAWMSLFRKAINVAQKRSRIAGIDGLECGQIWRYVELVYSAPNVQVQDEGEEINVAQGKLNLGVKRDVIIRELGYDPETEMEVQVGLDESGGTAGPTGALGSLSRQQFKRNMSGLEDLLGKLKEGESPVKVQGLLEEMGFSPDRAAALIADAQDGRVDDPSLLESAAQSLAVESSGVSSASRATPARDLRRSVEDVVEIVTCVETGRLPRDAGIAQLETLVGLTSKQAAAVMGSAGGGEARRDVIGRALKKWSELPDEEQP